MPTYRIFSVGEHGQLRRIGELDCANDAEILLRAGEFKIQGPVEIWQGARLVKRLDPASSIETSS